MKKLLIPVFLILCQFSISAREVYFIPGWYTEWKSYQNITDGLQKIFPGDTIHIRKWESNKLWNNAKEEAASYAEELAGELLRQQTVDITLIGHSLGGRITLDCVAELARQRKQLRQVILLGTADRITAEDIKNCQQVSLLPVINIFCVDDNLLKLFMFKEKIYPLGLVGLPRKTEHFRQYRLHVADHHIEVFNVSLLNKNSAKHFHQTATHLSPVYLERLDTIINGRANECYYDLESMEKLAAEHAVKPDTIPGYIKLEHYNGWLLEHRPFRRYYRITSPSGKKFYYSSRNHALQTFSRLKSALQKMTECFLHPV